MGKVNKYVQWIIGCKIMDNKENSIAMNNVDAKWIPVKGKMKMKQALNLGGEMKGNSIIRTDNRYKEFEDHM